MKLHNPSHSINPTWLLAVATIALGGCLEQEEKGEDSSSVMDAEISGSVGDGPIIGATIRILRNDGSELAQFESDANATYSISVRTDANDYPLSLHSSNGTDIVTSTAPDFDLLGSVFEQSQKTVANINPFSTLAVELARDMPGGESKSNLIAAQATVVSEFNHGLASVAASGPMTTEMNSTNISQIVRASEALAESIRRTRNALTSSGFSTSGNAVVQALASDLTDGVVDGLGAGRSDARYAAVSTIAAAQVLLESMANELHVNGTNATLAMSDAIRQISTQTADPTLEDLTTTAGMIARARIGLDAAFAVSRDPLIAELNNIVASIQLNTSSQIIKNFIFPRDYRTRLDNVILLVAGGNSTIHETVNEISRNSGSGGSINTAPTINGTPATSVSAGSIYSFTPTVNDREGDALTFDAANLPAWASFNVINGEISGTPSIAEAGIFPNITISVSDGEFTTSLPSFSISVNSGSPSNSAPSISGTPTTSVLVGDSYSFTPSASDPDGDSLVFSVSGLPSWANFSTSTGRISGTPASGHVGTYTNISVSVSDGQDSAQLPPFSITVDAIALGSVTLSWTPPTDNSDGSSLTNLAGYNIYWGPLGSSYSNSATINNPSLSTFVVENLSPGTYQFVATAFNSQGAESIYSNSATITIP